jgi:preprotein translocase subunit SecA
MHGVWEEFARTIFHLEVKVEGAEGAQRVFGPASDDTSNVNYSGGGPEQPSVLAEAQAAQRSTAGAATATAAAPAAAATTSTGGGQTDPTTGAVQKDDRDKIGRNDPCWCGSGKKFKKCHGA